LTDVIVDLFEAADSIDWWLIVCCLVLHISSFSFWWGRGKWSQLIWCFAAVFIYSLIMQSQTKMVFSI